MNIHKNARLTFVRRMEMVQDITSAWLERQDGSGACTGSAPRRRASGWAATWPGRGRHWLIAPRGRRAQPRAIDPTKALADRGTAPHAAHPGAHRRQPWASPRARSAACWRGPGLSRLSDLQPAEPVVRYEHEAPGRSAAHRHQEARAHRAAQPPGHRQSRATRSMGPAGSCCSWPSMTMPASPSPTCTPTRRRASAVQFLRNAVAYFASLGVHGQAAAHRQRLGVSLQALRRRPATSWASSTSSPGLPAADQWQGRALHPVGAARVGLRLHLPPLQRSARPPLDRWNHHYNWHRPHQGIGGLAPMSRLRQSRNNLLTLHT